MTSLKSEFVLPVGVKNYQTESGWNQAYITEAEEDLIQAAVRRRNFRVALESVEDAKTILAGCGVPDMHAPERVFGLAKLLAEPRTLYVRRACEEYLKAKVEAERQGSRTPLEDVVESGRP